jgi:hypothetical protein
MYTNRANYLALKPSNWLESRPNTFYNEMLFSISFLPFLGWGSGSDVGMLLLGIFFLLATSGSVLFLGLQQGEADVFLCLIKHSAMKTCGKVDVRIHVFLHSVSVGAEWSSSHSGRFTPRQNAPGTHWIGGWLGPGTCLDEMESRKIKPLPGTELRTLGRPARSQSLYRLCYSRSGIQQQTPIIWKQKCKSHGRAFQ